MSKVRLEVDGTGMTANGYRVSLDGHDISDSCRAISLKMDVNDVNVAQFEVFVDDVKLGADVDATLLRAKGKERTSFVSRFRTWIR